jgi:hypothetical protein
VVFANMWRGEALMKRAVTEHLRTTHDSDMLAQRAEVFASLLAALARGAPAREALAIPVPAMHHQFGIQHHRARGPCLELDPVGAGARESRRCAARLDADRPERARPTRGRRGRKDPPPMTDVEAQKLVTMLVTAYPNWISRLPADQQQTTMALYRRMILDLSYASANAAIERMIATSRFPPAIAEIREAVQTLELGPARTGAEAWGDVQLKFRQVHPDSFPNFADPVVERIVRSLGWREISLSENTTADRARFIDAYERVATTERRAQLSEGLPANRQLAKAQQERAIAAGAVTPLRPAAKAKQLEPKRDETEPLDTRKFFAGFNFDDGEVA